MIDNEDNFNFNCSNSSWCAPVYFHFALFFVKLISKTEKWVKLCTCRP